MTTDTAPRAARPSGEELLRRLQPLLDPKVQESVERLYQRYAKYGVTADELRAELDKVLGERRLTDELYRMRGA